MFARTKRSGRHEYLQIVHNDRAGGKIRQRVIGTLGRLDRLRESGDLGRLLSSLSRYAEQTAVLTAHQRGELAEAWTRRIGPDLVFGRLWEELGIRSVLEERLGARHFEFSVERAIYLTVLHRLFDTGSDRACEEWRHRYRVPGTRDLGLHHLYRAMAWLGEVLSEEEQAGATPFAPRTTKDVIEEALFARGRDLFSSLDVVFFDTTSLYFEGAGGESLGRHGHSKDHRPDRPQMVVGAVLDNDGRPLCSELWPGNTTDVTTLLPVVDRLRGRFGVGELTVVADRGMVSRKTIEALEGRDRGVHYILGARMRRVKEVRDVVLSRPGPYRVVRGPREWEKDPAPLKVKDVWVGARRYIVCLNEEQAAADRRAREAILAALAEQLRRGDKSLVGNKGYRRYLKTRAAGHFEIDENKVREEARYDGTWVLTTDLEMDAAEVALKYKELWRVESLFRSVKSVLETRPIYHQSDTAIRGHVFASFLALVLLSELERRMAARGWTAEWKRLKDDLDALEEIYVETEHDALILRSRTEGEAGKAIQAVGVALGPTVRFVEPTGEGWGHG
ncbi:MAG: IS1634 family transposase [Longimicrobiales bacterium]|nr:IS1634 family transposase [Longimicrobiales bacterium]